MTSAKVVESVFHDPPQYGVGLVAVHPPSTIKLCPVMWPDAGDKKNNAAWAMSATVAGLPKGVMRDHVFS